MSFLTDAEVLQDSEHDSARTRVGSPLSRRSPRLVILGSPAVLQLDGPSRSPDLTAAPSSTPRPPLRAEDAEGRAVHRARPIPRPDDTRRPGIRPRDLRDGRRQGQRRRPRRSPRKNHAFLHPSYDNENMSRGARVAIR